MSRQEATRLADEAGNEIGKADPQWEVIDAAIEMLRRWPDGEPVAQRVPNRRGRHDYWDYGETYNVALTPENLYTAPPDQDDRISALEQARVALEGLLRGCKRSTIQGLTGWHEKSIPSSEALDAGQDALRKIEEVQK